MYHPPQTKNFHFFILLLTLPRLFFRIKFLLNIFPVSAFPSPLGLFRGADSALRQPEDRRFSVCFKYSKAKT